MMANQYSEGDAELRVPMPAYWKGYMAKEEFPESDRAPAHSAHSRETEWDSVAACGI